MVRTTAEEIDMRPTPLFVSSVLLTLASPAWAVCGDGTLETGEECDDDNTDDLDGCDSSCAIEAG